MICFKVLVFQHMQIVIIKALQKSVQEKDKMKLFTIVTLSILLIFAILGMIFAQNLFYYPDAGKSNYTPADLGLYYEDIYFESLDGIKLHGWFMPSPKKAKGTVIHVHGNAGKLENHLNFAAWLPKEGYNLFMFDYRGFGLSQIKRQTPKALMEDTKAAIAYVRGRMDLEQDKLFIFAQSLGGNNAIAAIASGQRKGIRAILIDSTFTSYKEIADETIAYSGVFMSDKYSAVNFIADISPIPLLFIHGKNDSIIPYKHSEKLYTLAKHPKKLIMAPHAQHLGALQNEIYQNEALKFFEESLK
jgi:fermentation-respiration switch protein FrsA (DUF1100 family)